MADTILIVDDEANVIAALKRIFLEDAITILSATSALEGLELLKQNEVKLVISDERMPGITGSEFLSMVKQDYPHIVRIMLTGHASIEAAMKAINEGEIYRFFVKPWNDYEIRITVKTAVDKFNLEEELRQKRELIHHMAYHDALTGLPNRMLLTDRLTQALEFSRRNKLMVSVFFLDLDRFKIINDTFGHDTGDLLLKMVSERLRNAARKSDTIARHGGDEFIMMLQDIKDPGDVAAFAEKVLKELSKSFILSGQEFFITVSIGISLYPAHGEDIGSLIKKADIAMYHAKKAGKNNYQVYSPEMDYTVSKRMVMENELYKALERNEITMYYQPQVDIKTRQLVGCEALARWQHPELGLVSPKDFIPLAEENGLIMSIGEAAMLAACSENRAWQESGLPRLRMSVNISARQFRQDDLVKTVEKVLKQTGIGPEYLELEVTESIIMHDIGRAVEVLRRLNGMGISIAVDDFGTGYSSLSYMKKFPLAKLKIDQSFVRDLTSDPDDAAIVMAIIAMAHGLGIKVIAEGVETKEQLDFLRLVKCDEVQGYFFSKPLPADEFARLLEKPDWQADSN